MNITVSKIKALNPCGDRFNNFTTHYPDFNGSLRDFLNLDNITYSDKAWVFVRLATHVQNVRWSILCASSCLENFESLCPDDKRPRQAIEAADAFALNPSEENKIAARSAARSAADAADDASWSARSGAARSAAWPAAWSARSAAARSAFAYSASDYAVDAGNAALWAARSARLAFAYSAADSASSEAQQEELNLQFMVEACRE